MKNSIFKAARKFIILELSFSLLMILYIFEFLLNVAYKL